MQRLHRKMDLSAAVSYYLFDNCEELERIASQILNT